MVSFRPLGNANSRAFQFIVTLDVNDVNVLVDVGWDELLSKETLNELIEAIPSIDLILLTHATISHTGAFCYLRKKFPQFRAIPAYATLPVIRMSQMMTLEMYRCAGLCGPFDDPEAMSAEDVESIWSEVNNVKYSQPVKLQSHPKVEGIMITAYNGGHSLGGSLWKIYDGIDSVVIALDWNHARDAHLNGAFLEPKTGTVVADLQKPSLLITSTNVSSGQPLTKARQTFLNNVDDALKLGGTAMIPTSGGSRILELILILEKHMSINHKDIPLIYLTKFGKQTFTQASSMLEWMVPSIISDWQVQNESPFDTTRVQFIANITELQKKWPTGPKIVLVAGESLESGLSKEFFTSVIAEDEHSSVILNEISPPNTLGQLLWNQKKNERFTQLNLKIPQVILNSNEPLTNENLIAFTKKREMEREQANLAAAMEKRNQQLIDTSAQTVEESSESDEEYEEFDPSHIGSAVLIHNSDVYDYECPVISEDGLTGGIFPFNPKRKKLDEYGEYVPSELFNEKKNSNKNQMKQATTNIDVSPTDVEPQSENVGNVVAHQSSHDVELDGTTTETQHDYETPMKMVKVVRKNVNVICNIAYSDMNGMTDMRSLQMVIKQVQPMRVIALPGSEDVWKLITQLNPTAKMGNEFIKFDRTNFSVDVRLDPSMHLEWHDLRGGYSVSRVAGTLEFDPHDRIKKAGAVLIASNPSNESNESKDNSGTPERITIGDLRLTSLRKLLNDQGMNAEFRNQGVLVCNDNVIVQKTGDSSYVLQGGINEDYYKVRAAIRQFVTTL